MRKKPAKNKPTPKKKRGQPTKYKPEYCNELIAHLEAGLSFSCFRAVADVNKDTLFQWVKRHPEFAEAKEKGEALGEQFWESIGIRGMKGLIPGFNVTAWIFNMKNRYAWRDKQAITTEDEQGNVKAIDSGISGDKLTAMIDKLSKDIGK